jgi:uncharacterized membrane protein
VKVARPPRGMVTLIFGQTRQRTLHRLFEVGVVLKGIDGLLEVAGGVTFLAIGPVRLGAVVRFLTAHEISEDPGDLVANVLRRAVRHLSPDTMLFVSAYLVGHGLMKVLLVSGLLTGRPWAYPAALWFLGTFVVYQAYRAALTGSLALAALAALDLTVMALIARERRLRRGA